MEGDIGGNEGADISGIAHAEQQFTQFLNVLLAAPLSGVASQHDFELHSSLDRILELMLAKQEAHSNETGTGNSPAGGWERAGYRASRPRLRPRPTPQSARGRALLESLRNTHAEKQTATLVDRLPAEVYFDLFRSQARHPMRYAFGP